MGYPLFSLCLQRASNLTFSVIKNELKNVKSHPLQPLLSLLDTLILSCLEFKIWQVSNTIYWNFITAWIEYSYGSMPKQPSKLENGSMKHEIF